MKSEESIYPIRVMMTGIIEVFDTNEKIVFGGSAKNRIFAACFLAKWRHATL